MCEYQPDPVVMVLFGPDRVIVDDPAPKGWVPSRIGFTPPRVEAEPLLWDGDQA